MNLACEDCFVFLDANDLVEEIGVDFRGDDVDEFGADGSAIEG